VIEFLEWLFEFYWIKGLFVVLVLRFIGVGLFNLGFWVGMYVWNAIHAMLVYIMIWDFWQGGLAPYWWIAGVGMFVMQLLYYTLFAKLGESRRTGTPDTFRRGLQ